jgi:hypothetical protein
MKDPTHAEMYAFLETQACGSEDIRFDIEEAIYWFAADYHGGQWSNLYEALCASEYNPGMCARGPSDAFFYDMLVAEYGDTNPEGNLK